MKVNTCAQLSKALPQFPSTVLVFQAPGMTEHLLQFQVCCHLFVQVSYWLLCVVTKCPGGCPRVGRATFPGGAWPF